MTSAEEIDGARVERARAAEGHTKRPEGTGVDSDGRSQRTRYRNYNRSHMIGIACPSGRHQYRPPSRREAYHLSRLETALAGSSKAVHERGARHPTDDATGRTAHAALVWRPAERPSRVPDAHGHGDRFGGTWVAGAVAVDARTRYDRAVRFGVASIRSTPGRGWRTGRSQPSSSRMAADRGLGLTAMRLQLAFSDRPDLAPASDGAIIVPGLARSSRSSSRHHPARAPRPARLHRLAVAPRLYLVVAPGGTADPSGCWATSCSSPGPCAGVCSVLARIASRRFDPSAHTLRNGLGTAISFGGADRGWCERSSTRRPKRWRASPNSRCSAPWGVRLSTSACPSARRGQVHLPCWCRSSA